jgi:hypothetical protein
MVTLKIAVFACACALLLSAVPAPADDCSGSPYWTGTSWTWNCHGTCTGSSCSEKGVGRWVYCACNSQGDGNDETCIEALHFDSGPPPTTTAVCLPNPCTNCDGAMQTGEPPIGFFCWCNE